MEKLNILISVATLAIVSFLALKSSLVETASLTPTVIQSQSTALSSSVQTADTSDPEELQSLRLQISELTDMVRELSLQVAATTNSNTVSVPQVALSQATLEADALGAEFVEQVTAQGVLEGENKHFFNQHLSKMSPQQRKNLTQSIARAVNEQRLRFDPSAQY